MLTWALSFAAVVCALVILDFIVEAWAEPPDHDLEIKIMRKKK